MIMEICILEEVYFNDEKIFGDNEKHYYDAECFDGYAIATKRNDYEDDKAPAKLKLTYPKREEVIKNEELANEVLDYRGLDDRTIEEMSFGDIMLYLGELEVIE